MEVTDPTPGEVLVQGESPEEFITIIRAEETQKKFQSNFLHNLFDLYLEGGFNDVTVQCQHDKRIQIPGLLLAAVSPVFKVAALGIGTTPAEQNGAPDLYLPDVQAEDLTIFVRRLCQMPADIESETPPLDDGTLILHDPFVGCLLYTSPSPRDQRGSRMPSSA